MLTGRGDGRFDVSWFGAVGENSVGLAIADLRRGHGLADRVPLDCQTTIRILMVPGGHRPGSYLTHLVVGSVGKAVANRGTTLNP